MEDIIAHARELGKKIATHPRCAEFMHAARVVAEDQEAQKILRAYQEQAARLQQLEAAGRPIEPADKHKLEESRVALAGNEKLKAMLRHQANYLEMMNRINQAMDEAVSNLSAGSPPQQ